jgi:hypothetical protein
MEIDDKWISGKKYLDMSEYLQWIKSISVCKIPRLDELSVLG